jgi:predicted RNase H-like HicB family nuclease
MSNFTFRAIIEKDDPGYHGYVPTLPGCHTCGDTIEETRKNLREAIQCHVEGLLLDGEKIPVDESVEVFETITADQLKIPTELALAYA